MAQRHLGWLYATLLLVCLATAGAEQAGWQDRFERAGPGGWQAYGEGCRIEAAQVDGQRGLVARFDDTSGVAWANKGFRIAFPQGISWKSFRYLVHRYRLEGPASALGYLLHDRAGNWWRAAFPAPAPGRWRTAAVRAGAFGFGWNDDPNLIAPERDSQIVELFLYGATEKVNTGAAYVLAIDDVALTRTLTEDAGEPVSAAPGPMVPLGQEFGPHPLQWKVAGMDRRGYLTVGGKPFFPLGLYSCLGIDQASGAHGESHYKGKVDQAKVGFWMRSVRDAGFNTLQTYTMQFYGAEVDAAGKVLKPTTPGKLRAGWIRFMDAAHAHGLKVMAGCAPPYCAVKLPAALAERARALAAWKAQTRANVLAWRKHPALLAWYHIDEPSTVALPARDLVEQYRYLKALDRAHPFVIASCSATDVQYRQGLDVFAPDPYPIETGVPLRELPARIRPLRALQRGTPPLPQVWAVIQICQWQEGKRLPTAEEIRLQSLLALTEGVTGLLFYEFKNYAGSNPAHWASVGRAVRSLRPAIAALLDATGNVRDCRASDRRLYARAVEAKAPGGTKVYTVIAANPSQNVAGDPLGLGQVTLTIGRPLPKGATAYAIDEDAQGRFRPGSRRPVKLSKAGAGFALTDEFGPLAARVYRIARPWAGPGGRSRCGSLGPLGRAGR